MYFKEMNITITKSCSEYVINILTCQNYYFFGGNQESERER